VVLTLPQSASVLRATFTVSGDRTCGDWQKFVDDSEDFTASVLPFACYLACFTTLKDADSTFRNVDKFRRTRRLHVVICICVKMFDLKVFICLRIVNRLAFARAARSVLCVRN
jgi:hypothetical protein